MSASTYVCASGSVALVASATKTIVLVNPAVVGIRLTEVGVSFDPAAAVVAPRVELYRVTTIGSPAGSGGVIVKANAPLDVASQSAALTNLTTEPTAVEVLRQWFIQPAGGLFVLQHPLGREPATSGAGARIGLRIVTAAAVTPNCSVYLEWEE